jgi:hypothetical protein
MDWKRCEIASGGRGGKGGAGCPAEAPLVSRGPRVQFRDVRGLPVLLLLIAAAPVPGSLAGAPREPGLWAGSLPLCGAVEARIEPESDAHPLELILRFPASIQPRLEQETTRLLYRPMPIRLDGETVASPIVNEPIRGDGVAIVGPVGDMLERIERAARMPCAAAARP